METQEAFDTLFKAASAELEKVQQEGATYFASGDTAHVRDAADQVERIQAVILAVGQLKDLWEKAIPFEAPTITPNPIVIMNQTTPPGMKTLRERFGLPILQALVEMGGKGLTSLVLDRVGETMTGDLSDIDQEILPGRSDIRWRNTAQLARLDLVKSGYLSDRSPNDTWEITEEGRKYLDGWIIF